MLRHLLTLLLSLQLALAPMARAGVTSTVTGADFGDAFRGSFISSVVALGLADVQTGIGVVFACGSTLGVGCVLMGVGGAAVAVGTGDEVYDGVVTLVTGEAQQNPTEAVLEGLGYSPAQAQQIHGWINTGATLVELAAGGVGVFKAGKMIGYLDNGPTGKPNLTKFDTPLAVDVDALANPGTRPGAVDAEAGGFSYYDQYKKADGSGWNWPDNLGFAGTPTEATIPVGTRLDRYGSPQGSFMSPAGTPLELRAMAPGSAAEPLHTYEVIKPLPVIQGEVAPAFGQSGGGTQMLPNLSERVNVDWLVINGYLEVVN